MDSDKLLKLTAFSESRYQNIDLDRLVLFAANRVKELDADLSFENICIVAFKLFPKKFSLQGYSFYPDSNRVYSCLWRCSTDKKKLWIGGKINTGYVITERAQKYINECAILLENTEKQNPKASSETRRKERIIKEIIESSAFKKYRDNSVDEITNADIRFMLQGTMETPIKILRDNLLTLTAFSQELNKTDVIDFLKLIEKKFNIL